MFEDALDLAVLALAQACVSQTLSPWARSSVASTGPYSIPSMVTPFLQLVEIGLVHVAEGAHAVAAQPAGVGMGDHLGEPAVVGEQQQAFGVDVEPAMATTRGAGRGQAVEHGGASLGVAGGRW